MSKKLEDINKNKFSEADRLEEGELLGEKMKKDAFKKLNLNSNGINEGMIKNDYSDLERL